MIFVALVAAVYFAIITSSTASYIRGCYYTNWAQYRPNDGRYLPENYQPGLCTHIFYAFAVMNSDFTMKPFEWNDESTDWSKGMYERMVNMKKSQPDLKVLLSFGGWVFSEQNPNLLPNMCSSIEHRSRFIKSVIDFVRKHNFDGFDFDYEYPTAKDKDHYTTLVKELRAAFDKEAKDSGKPKLLLTAAVAAGFDKIEAGYDVPAVAAAFDFLNVMTYDFHGSWEQKTGMNSPLTDRDGDRYSIKDAAETWISKGAPKNKLLIGFAAYGRGWTLSDPSSHDVGCAAGTGSTALPYSRQAGVATYYEICDLLEKGGVRYYDEAQQSPYVVKDNQWFSYDDAQSFQVKIDWVKSSGFAGAFIWSLDQDDFAGKCSSSSGQRYPLHQLILKALTSGTMPKPIVLPTSAPNRTMTTTTQKPLKPNKFLTTKSNSGFKCESAGVFADPVNCDKFIMCDQNLVAQSMNCPTGLLFNKNVFVCDWAQNVQC